MAEHVFEANNEGIETCGVCGKDRSEHSSKELRRWVYLGVRFVPGAGAAKPKLYHAYLPSTDNERYGDGDEHLYAKRLSKFGVVGGIYEVSAEEKDGKTFASQGARFLELHADDSFVRELNARHHSEMVAHEKLLLEKKESRSELPNMTLLQIRASMGRMTVMRRRALMAAVMDVLYRGGDY